MKKTNKSLLFLIQAAMIAAVYVALTFLFQAISFGPVQLRIAEALVVLPAFTPAAVPGLFMGCFLGNLLGGALLPDILFGSLATLMGALGTWKLKNHKYLLAVPPIAANTLMVPLILRFAYGTNLPLPLLALSVFGGEFLSCGVLGTTLYAILSRSRHMHNL